MGEPIVWSSLEGERSRTPWLWGKPFDALVIGSASSLVFAALAVLATFATPRFGPAIVVVFMHLGIAVNYPHYAATYQLVYRERHKSPRSYKVLLASIPVVLLVVVVAAAYERALLPILLRVYLTWSPYHYAKQHFGIASMYSARKGKPLAAGEKSLLQAAFVAQALFMIVTLNASSLDPSATQNGTVLLHPILPSWTYLVALAFAIAGIVVSLIAYARHRARTGEAWSFMVTLLLVVNFVWFVVPNVWIPGHTQGPWVGPRLGVWIPVAIPFFHCAQYLGMTTHRARTTGPVRPVILLIVLMLLGYGLFEVTAQGLEIAVKMTEDHSLLLMASIVNVHHFWLDGIVWKGPQKKPAPAEVPAVAA